MSLSVCLLTRNEENNIARALRSVAGLADEVIVADTASVDRTAQIATELGAKVCPFEWNDDFSAGRNAQNDARGTAAMSKPFDATLKDLAGIAPGLFLAEVDAPPTLPVRLLNVDLSTVTAAADIVFGLGDPLQEVVHLDIQAGPDADKHLDILAYNGLLHRQHRVPVHSILLLLRSKAAHSNQTGSITYQPRPGRGKMDFGYEVLRLWERPAEALLAGALPTLPLAPLGRLPSGLSLEEGMRQIVEQVVERLQREGAPEVVPRLLTATFVLSGLRLNREQVRTIFAGVRAMRESDTYQAILDEGEVRGVLRVLLRQGSKKLGEPDEATRQALMSISDLDRLDRLSEGLLGVSTWQELLQVP